MISMVFYTEDRQFAFQKVERYWNLYDGEGNFIEEFRSFDKLQDAIIMRKMKVSKPDDDD